MATIGSLQVNIVANTAGFTKGVQRTQALATGLAGKIGGLTKSLVSLGSVGSLVGGTVAAAFGFVVNSAIAAGGHIYELTKKLHISSEEITALHYAAEQLESSSEAVDAAIAKMSITLGQALMGSKESAGAFAQLGLNIDQVSKLTKANRFLAIVEALHKVKDESKRAALSQAILGKGSKELAALYEAGSDKIIESAQEAADAGSLMGSNTAKNLDDSGDAITRLGASWRAFRDDAVSNLAPAIEYLAWSATESMLAVRLIFESFKTVISGALAVATAGIYGFAELLNKILPKSMQIDTDKIKKFYEASEQQLTDQKSRTSGLAKSYLGIGGAQPNPLQTPPAPSTVVEQNTAKAADTLDKLLAEMRKRNGGDQQQRPGPMLVGGPDRVTVAGVR